MEDESRHLRNQISNMKADAEVLQEELGSSEKRLREIETEKRQLNKKLDLSKKEKSDREREKEEFDDKIEGLMEIVLKIRKKLQKNQLEEVLERENLLNDIEKINQQRLAAEKLGEDNSQQDELFQKKILEIENKVKLKKIEKDDKSLREEIENSKRDLLDFTDDLKKQEEKRSIIKKEIERLKKEIAYLKIEIDELINEEKKIAKDNYIINDDIKRSLKEIAEAERELREWEDKSKRKISFF